MCNLTTCVVIFFSQKFRTTLECRPEGGSLLPPFPSRLPLSCTIAYHLLKHILTGKKFKSKIYECIHLMHVTYMYVKLLVLHTYMYVCGYWSATNIYIQLWQGQKLAKDILLLANSTNEAINLLVFHQIYWPASLFLTGLLNIPPIIQIYKSPWINKPVVISTLALVDL